VAKSSQVRAVQSLQATVDLIPSTGTTYSGVIEEYHDVPGFILAQRPAKACRSFRSERHLDTVPRWVPCGDAAQRPVMSSTGRQSPAAVEGTWPPVRFAAAANGWQGSG
jgi:hypothetical protein